MHDDTNISLLLENALDAVIGIDGRELVIYWNHRAETTFGWSKAEALGRRMSEMIIPPRYREAHARGMRHFDSTGEGPILNRRIEIFALNRAGEEFPVELTVTAAKTEGGHVFYSFLRDITDRRRAEEALKGAIQARDDFLSICSHELKTPLTALKLQYQLVTRRLEKGDPTPSDPAVIRKRIKLATRQIDRMVHLIDDMLDVSRISDGKLPLEKEDTDLARLVRETTEGMAEQLRAAGTGLTLALPSSPLPVHCDPFRIEQVIVNLLTNAGLKYGAGKPVSVAVERGPAGALISVRDQGIGMAEADLGRIFHKFERLHVSRHYGGVGLGLYISQKIVEAHGGRIRVESRPGEGSCFTVELPY